MCVCVCIYTDNICFFLRSLNIFCTETLHKFRMLNIICKSLGCETIVPGKGLIIKKTEIEYFIETLPLSVLENKQRTRTNEMKINFNLQSKKFANKQRISEA